MAQEPFGGRAVKLLPQPIGQDESGADGVAPQAAAAVLRGDRAAECDHRRLRRGVGGLPGVTQEGLAGRGVHHGTAPALEDVGDGRLAAEHRPAEVRAYRAIPRVEVEAEHIDVGRREVHRAGVVVQHVDATERRHRGRDEAVYRRLVGDVDLDPDGSVPRGHDCGRARSRAVGVEVGDNDGCALLGEPVRGRRSDPVRGTGDDCHLPVEAAHHRTALRAADSRSTTAFSFSSAMSSFE